MSLSAVLVILAVLAAVVDWWSVRADRSGFESLAKPAVMILLASAVAASGPSVAGWFVVVALAFSLLGDLALLPAVDRFLPGLAAFLVGHLAYGASFVIGAEDPSPTLLLVGAAISALTFAVVGRHIVRRAADRSRALALPVAVYVGILSTMLALGLFTGALVAGLGALLFAASDAVLGWNRFVEPLRNGRLATHVLYHVGQGLIAVWAIGL